MISWARLISRCCVFLLPPHRNRMTFCPFRRKVHTVPLALMYAQFTQTTPDGLDVAKVTELQTLQPCGDFLLCPRVSEACEPLSKFIRLLDCDHSLM